MKKKVMMIFIILVTFSVMFLVTGCTARKNIEQELVNDYFVNFYTQNKLGEDGFSAKRKSKEDIPEYFALLEEFIDDKYGDVFTTFFLRSYLVREEVNRYIELAAKYQNANISLHSVELTEVESKVEDLFYNFTLLVKMDYIEEAKEDLLLEVKGQIKLTKENDKYKIHSIRHFSNELNTYTITASFIDSVENQISRGKENSDEIKEVDFEGFSTEGSVVSGHYDESTLKVFSVWHFGEMGKVNKEYRIYKEDEKRNQLMSAYIKTTTIEYLEPFNQEDARETIEYYHLYEKFLSKANEDYSGIDRIKDEEVRENIVNEIKEYISILDGTF